MLVHLTPVWIYLGKILLSFKKYKNTSYIITDYAIYTSTGTFKKTFNTKLISEITHISLKRGLFEQRFNVGDITITSNPYNSVELESIELSNVPNYTEIYDLISNQQKEIYNKIKNNNLAPEENEKEEKTKEENKTEPKEVK